MKIEYVTHASLLCRTEQTTLLTDPFFFLSPMYATLIGHFPPRELAPAHFGTIDYLFSSHIHDDHCDENTLALLRDRVKTVLLPGERPQLEARYRHVGYTDIRLLAHGVTQKLNDEMSVTCFWSDPVDTILVVQLGDKTLIHVNDCRPTAALMKEVGERFSVDYLFLLYTEAQVLLYPLLLDLPEEEIESMCVRKEEGFFADRLSIIDAIAPRVVIPYSMTLSYFQPDQRWVNRHYRLTPPMFKQRLAAARPDLACWVVEPGDVIETSTEAIEHYREESLWGRDVVEFEGNIAAYAETAIADGTVPRFQPGEIDTIDAPFRSFLNDRMTRPLGPLLDGRKFLFHVVGATRRASYLANFASSEVRTYGDGDSLPTDTFIEITLPPAILQLTLARAMDPFSVVHSHRIRFKRNGELPRQMWPREEAFFYLDTYMALCE